MVSSSNMVLASTVVRDQAGSVDLRIFDLAWDYANCLPGRPFEVMLSRFREHGLGWDDVDPGNLFRAFNPRHLNMYNTMEDGNPRLGFFGGANPVVNRDAVVSGMPLLTFCKQRLPAAAEAVVEQVNRVTATRMPLLQYVRLEHRQTYYHRLMLPAANTGGAPSKVLAFCDPFSLFFGSSLLERPPGMSYN